MRSLKKNFPAACDAVQTREVWVNYLFNGCAFDEKEALTFKASAQTKDALKLQ